MVLSLNPKSKTLNQGQRSVAPKDLSTLGARRSSGLNYITTRQTTRFAE